MLWMVLVVLWIEFAVTFCAGLVSARRGARVLGVAFPANQAHSPEVNRVVRTYQIRLTVVFVLLTASSSLLLLPAAGERAELWMLLLVAVNLLLVGLVQNFARRRLLALRAEKGWTPPMRKTVSADLQASRDKVKGALSPAYVWVCFALSFLPAAVLLAVPSLRADFPLPFAFLGPVCQLFTVFMYYQMRSLPIRTQREDTAACTEFAQKSIRVYTVSAVVMAISMLAFWLVFNLSTAVLKNIYVGLGAAVLMFAADIAAAFWQQKRVRKLEESYMDVRAAEDPAPEAEWKWGCYYNPADPRIFVPKPVESLGWTLNIGRPAGKAIMIGILALVAAIVVAFVGMANLDFSVTVAETQLEMDAPFYDLTVERGQVESAELVQSLPANGTRTNGYGGISKSYGHFRFDGYGACMMYVYNDTDVYVQLRLTGEDPAYVFLNAETEAETEELYAQIRQWLAVE